MTTRNIDTLFRDFETNGVPSSGYHKPIKADIRDSFNAWLLYLTGANVGALIQTSKTALDDLTPDANTMAWVVGDGDPDLDGVYQYASSVWTKRSPLPYSIIQLNNADAGTANALQVTTAVGIPTAAYKALYVLNITQTNTGAVTVSINGDTAVPLVSNTNATIPSGYLQAGMAVLCVDDGTSLRLLSYGDASSIQAAAETARDEAETARDEAVVAAALSAQIMVRARVVDTIGATPATDYEAGDTVDGITLVATDLVLRATEGGDVDDGLYVVQASGAAVRATTFDAYDDFPGAQFNVMEGVENADTSWRGTCDIGGTLGVDDIVIEQMLAAPATTSIIDYIKKTFVFAAEHGAVHDFSHPTTGAGTDNKTAYENAIDEAIGEEKILIMPPGFGRLASKIDYTGAGYTGPDGKKRLTLRMEGVGGRHSGFVVDNDENADGALFITANDATTILNVQLSRFAVMFTNSAGTIRNSGSYALKIEHTPAPSLRPERGVWLDDFCTFSYDNTDGTPDVDVELSGIWGAKMRDCRLNTLLSKTSLANQYRNTWEPYAKTAALHVDDCYSFVAERCLFRGGGQKAPVWITTDTAEGGQFVDCVSTDGKYCVLIDGTSNEPGFAWFRGHGNARDGFLDAKRGKSGQVVGVLIYIDDGTLTYGSNSDSITNPRLFYLESTAGEHWHFRDNFLQYADHTNIANINALIASQTSSQRLALHNTRSTVPFSHGFWATVSGVKHKIAADNNDFGGPSGSSSWYNGNKLGGYQYHNLNGSRTEIWGINDPNGWADPIPINYETGDIVWDPSLATGVDRWRLTSTGPDVWTRY